MVHLAQIAMAIALMGEAQIDRLDPKEVACLADNIYHEARGESVAGQKAVAHVTLNRVAHHAYPDTICGVVHQRRQFSWTRNAPLPVHEPAAYENALMVALSAMQGLSVDPSRGATHFYDHRRVNPDWARRLPTTAVIDGHTFKKSRDTSPKD